MDRKIFILILLFILTLGFIGCNDEKCDGSHRDAEWIVIKEATCNEQGAKNLVCKKCDEIVTTAIIDYANHTEGTWETLTESSCYQKGTKILKCSICDITLETSEAELASHTVVVDEALEPTCEKSGLSEGSHCSVCKEVITPQKVIKAIGHEYELNESKSTGANLYYECTKCKDYYEEENPNNTCKNHTESDWETVSRPTCTEQGLKQKVCTNCGLILKKENIPADDHVPGEWVIDEESTCIKTGHKHKVCEICFEEVEQQTIALSDHKAEVIPAVLAKCTETGLTEGSKCSVCNHIIKAQEVTPETGHSYKLTFTKPSTKEEEGYLEYTCESCNDSYQKVIPVIGNYDPNTPTSIFLSDNNTFVENDNGGVLVENNTITISMAGEYDLSGKLTDGNIIISLEETDQATINLKGVEISSSSTNPIFVESGDKVDISANRNTVNYISDNRKIEEGIDSVGAAIYSKIDLDIKGNGELYIKSSYNNGLATTKDLEIKNLKLEVNAPNNAIKGNDSITIESGTIKSISSSNDALATENSDISDKGNQRGIITINGGTLDLFAACDAIDASYNVIINGGTINAYTEKYSEYSGEVSVTNSTKMYIRVSSRSGISNAGYTYAMKFIKEDNSYEWKTGVKLGNQRSVYYELDVPSDAKYLKVYCYSANQTVGDETNYVYSSDQLAVPTAYDEFYITSVNKTSKLFVYQWNNYSQSQMGGGFPGGPGGMGPGMEGNNDKAAYSCKGIKADNEIIINDGVIYVESHDDAIHTNSDVLLDTGKYGAANITINGGNITLYSDDDALHADGTLTVNNGNVVITNSYEGVEGTNIYFKGGMVQIKAMDDGINAKTSLNFNGGNVYLDSGGDGIDSNATAVMTGGVVLAQGPSNGGNGVIDFDRSFSFSGGLLLAIGCNGMNQKPSASSGNTSTSKTISTNTSSYVNVVVNGEIVASIKVTKNSQNYCVLAYNNTTYPSASTTVTTSISQTLTNNLYYIK